MLFKENLIRRIAIGELGGGGDLKDSHGCMEMVSDGVTTGDIPELNGMMSRKPIGRKRGPIDDRISKLLVRGDQLMPETQLKIGKIGPSLKDFVGRRKKRMDSRESILSEAK